MQLINKKTDYAIRAMIYLELNKGRFISANEISKNDKIPYQFLRRILQELTGKGFIVSREGISGGVMINKKPGDIYLTDLIGLFQGDIELANCMFRSSLCEKRSECVLRERIKKVERKVINEFENITIEDLVKDIT